MNKYFLLFLVLFASCSDDVNNVNIGNSVCESENLEIREGELCVAENSIWVCDLLEVEEIQYLDEEAYEWAPNLCSYSVGDQLEFKNEGNSTFWDIVEYGHYINKEKVRVTCNGNMERITYICQKNEVLNVSLIGSMFGADTFRLELGTMILDYEGKTVGDKRNILTFKQDRSFSNVVNFYMRHFIENEEEYDYIWQSYSREITLDGQVYNDVLAYETKENVWAEPDIIYYVQKGVGILGFEKDDKLWLRN